MSRRWFKAPYVHNGVTYGSLIDTTPGRERIAEEWFILDKTGKPLGSIIKNARTDTFDVRALGTISPKLIKAPNGGCFKTLSIAMRWCDDNEDWQAAPDPEEPKPCADGCDFDVECFGSYFLKCANDCGCERRCFGCVDCQEDFESDAVDG
jgi:hypothetical protein